ncbi:MAG TPA: hypothetical protein VMI75_09665 [Polyangiaceae bacterium]|nr:hypothetical protein [Polyangiaceae bacterium]
MLKLVSRSLLLVGVALGVCSVSGDAVAQTATHSVAVTLVFGGARYQGTSTGVTVVETAVNGAMQHRVNLIANLGGRPGMCTVAVANVADASHLKSDFLDAHATAVTCTVSHPVTTDLTAGTFVFLNTLTPSTGDSLTIENH